MNKKAIVKKIIYIAFITFIIVSLFLTGICILTLLAIKPTEDDLKFNKLICEDSYITSCGDKLEAKSIQVFDSKDNFTVVYVNEKKVLTIEPAIKDYETNKVEKDILNIKGEYTSKNERVYVFNWGIIYSVDNGKTFLGTAKYNYDEEYERNNDFRFIVDTFELNLLIKTN